MVIETFIGSGLPQTSAAALVNASAASTERPAAPRSRASAIIRPARGSTGLCSGWPYPGSALRSLRCSRATASAAASSEPQGVGASQHVFDQLAAKVGRAQDDRSAAEHAGRDRALKRGGIGVVGHTRRLSGWRQAMLGKRDQAKIEKEALILGRRPAGREQKGIVGEGHVGP